MSDTPRPTILSQFEKHPKEAAIVGRLLTGYGELEFILYLVLARALGSQEIAARLLFRVRGEKQRIEIADSVLRTIFTRLKLEGQYCETRAALHHCRKIRNQYAHCHWRSDTPDGLFFTNIEAAAQKGSGGIMLAFHHIDERLLLAQEEYFISTGTSLAWLVERLDEHAGRKLPNPPIPRPSKISAPPLHNPPEEHPLPSRGKDAPPREE